MARRVLVTGGSGFLGGHVIPLLVAKGDVVHAVVRSRTAAQRVERLGAKPVTGDLDDPASTDEAFAASDAEALVNLASLGFGHAPAIVAAAEDAGIKRAVFVSTTAVFTTLSTRSKQTRLGAEEAVRSSGLEWTIIRPTMIYGTPADRNMARLLELLRRFPLVPVPGGGRGLQQPVHVDDLAQAIVGALDASLAVGQVYGVAGPDALTFRQIAEEAGRAVGRPPRLVPVPLGPAVAGLRLYERLSSRPRLRAEQLERLVEDKCFDIAPARRDLGFDPRPFSEGIRQEAALLA